MQIRKARLADIPQVNRLVNGYAESGIMLRRPLAVLYENIRDLVVAEEEGNVLGTGGLHVMWQDLAEVRSLAVLPERKGDGIGRRLVEFMLEEARDLGIGRVFALTYQRPFFERQGFTVVSKESLPQKVWTECVYCEKFNSCDEIAMERWLREPGSGRLEEIPLIERPLWVRG